MGKDLLNFCRISEGSWVCVVLSNTIGIQT